MKKIFVLCILLMSIIPVLTAAADGMNSDDDKNSGMMKHKMHSSVLVSPYILEMEAILGSLDDKKIGDMTFDQLKQINMDLSVPLQKIQFIKKSEMASRMIPGMGQFINKEVLGGTLFLVSSLAIKAGSLVGAYFLMPADLRFDQLNYFTAPKADIKQTWESHSMQDVLPAFAVLTGGMVLDAILSKIASRNAGRLAAKNISEGNITFEPVAGITGGLHTGIKMRWAY